MKGDRGEPRLGLSQLLTARNSKREPPTTPTLVTTGTPGQEKRTARAFSRPASPPRHAREGSPCQGGPLAPVDKSPVAGSGINQAHKLISRRTSRIRMNTGRNCYAVRLSRAKHRTSEPLGEGPLRRVAEALPSEERLFNFSRLGQRGCAALLTAATERDEGTALSAAADNRLDMLNGYADAQPFTERAAFAAIRTMIAVRHPHFLSRGISGRSTKSTAVRLVLSKPLNSGKR